MLEDLASLKRRALALAERIGASEGELPTFGYSLQDGRPHIEVGETYDFVICERGREFGRVSTTDLDELLDWTFECATFARAVDFERQHRRPDEDSRRRWFALQEALLGELSEGWKARKVEDHRLTLERAPFSDGR